MNFLCHHAHTTLKKIYKKGITRTFFPQIIFLRSDFLTPVYIIIYLNSISNAIQYEFKKNSRKASLLSIIYFTEE